jgi:N-acetylmuramoyl-L-alanine amidase
MKLSVFICFLAISLASFSQGKKITVVIDAGHGGNDHGFIAEDATLLPEKSLNLLIANKVGGYIQQYLTNIEIVYTRTDDTFISLDDRVYKANSINADLFISIHCNANDHQMVHGTESHVHTMDSKKSVDLAQIMEKEFSSKAGRHSRGVKDSDDRQHSLQVLKYTNMTSVLIECGFMTNVKEAKYLNTTEGQDVIASAIFRGLRTYVQKENPNTNFIKSTTTAKPIAKNNATAPTTSPKNSSTASSNATVKSVDGTYAIQILSTKEPIETDAPAFKKIDEKVIRQKVNTTSEFKYRYLVGSFDTREAGATTLKKLQTNGFKDAIIIQLD